ncbi:YciC family protein [Budvicia aquatica]|uniref:UPF0259 membrane protein CRN84_19195 n=2 Tax=Budvicia aquatica TaxID=82979 RepID=A0A2C6DRI4_9GAMM|nr:YciC family protein [Budvicia aquatica]PHI31313.1 hypothetical protein CRN84_19195 [Budvicia aquatica]
MSITANSLSRDSVNFIRNQLSSFIMLALLTSFIMVALLHALAPDLSELQALVSNAVGGVTPMSRSELRAIVAAMPKEQQIAIAEATIPLVTATAGSFLISNLLLTAGVITLVQQVSNQQATSAIRALGASVHILPKLLILFIISTFVILIGLSFYFLPGIFLTYALVLSPAILISSQKGIIDSIIMSWKIALANIKIILPAFLFAISVEFLLYALTIEMAMRSSIVVSILLVGAGNLITAYFLVYLFRFYMLVKQ